MLTAITVAHGRWRSYSISIHPPTFQSPPLPTAYDSISHTPLVRSLFDIKAVEPNASESKLRGIGKRIIIRRLQKGTFAI